MSEEVTWGRIDKIETWIQKITEVSIDLKSMLAVHEQRIGQHDKDYEYIEEIVEKRRIELDGKVDAIYNTMRDQDNKILEEIKNLRIESTKQHETLSEKIAKMEKLTWIVLGAAIVFIFIIEHAANYLQLFVK
jgi:hypothetical protein